MFGTRIEVTVIGTSCMNLFWCSGKVYAKILYSVRVWM